MQKNSHKNELFWNSHIDAFHSSGLSRKEYCRRNNLNYGNLWYWMRKKSIAPPQQNNLIEVKLKPDAQTAACNILCTVQLKNGHALQIHDSRVLSEILTSLC